MAFRFAFVLAASCAAIGADALSIKGALQRARIKLDGTQMPNALTSGLYPLPHGIFVGTSGQSPLRGARPTRLEFGPTTQPNCCTTDDTSLPIDDVFTNMCRTCAFNLVVRGREDQHYFYFLPTSQDSEITSVASRPSYMLTCSGPVELISAVCTGVDNTRSGVRVKHSSVCDPSCMPETVSPTAAPTSSPLAGGATYSPVASVVNDAETCALLPSTYLRAAVESSFALHNPAILTAAERLLNQELTAIAYHHAMGTLSHDVSRHFSVLAGDGSGETEHVHNAIRQMANAVRTMRMMNGATDPVDTTYNAVLDSHNQGHGRGRRLGAISAGTWSAWFVGIMTTATACQVSTNVATAGALMVVPQLEGADLTLCYTAAFLATVGALPVTIQELVTGNPDSECQTCLNGGQQWCWESDSSGHVRGCQSDNFGLPDSWMCSAPNCASNSSGSHCSIANNDCVRPS